MTETKDNQSLTSVKIEFRDKSYINHEPQTVEVALNAQTDSDRCGAWIPCKCTIKNTTYTLHSSEEVNVLLRHIDYAVKNILDMAIVNTTQKKACLSQLSSTLNNLRQDYHVYEERPY